MSKDLADTKKCGDRKASGVKAIIRGRPSVLIPVAQEILKEYNSRITIRQLFYRLVSKGIVPNSESSYTMLIQRMIVARRDGRIPFEVFEDRTWHSFLGESPCPIIGKAEVILANGIDVYENAEEYALNQLKNAYSEFDLPYWYKQPNYVEVWLEKEALANLFQPIAEKYYVTFVPCRGYPRLSLLYDCAQRFKKVPNDKEVCILYFGDYDMRDLNIEQPIAKNLCDDFGIQAKVIRFALTREQIAQFQLPPNPAKIKDTMARGWKEKNGNVAWELDALEPHVLENILDKAIQSQINQDILTERNNNVSKTREAMQIQVKEYLAEVQS